MEDRLDIFNQITHEVSNLKYEIESIDSSNENIKWIISELHELLDNLLLTEQK